MKIEQLTVFLENQSGRLADVATILASQAVNICAISLADSADFGILRFIVDDTERASAALKGQGFTITKTEVVGVQVPDRPGGLAEILRAIKSSGINVEYMYAFGQASTDSPTVIFRFNDLDGAIACLQKAGIKIVSGISTHA